MQVELVRDIAGDPKSYLVALLNRDHRLRDAPAARASMS
jgi:hypothetical protein